MKFKERLTVTSHKKRVKLKDYDPGETFGLDKDKDGDPAMARNIARLDELQYVLYAENRRALLVILQGMDTAGKDGTIRHVMSGASPQSCKVTSFKVPSAEEAAHDFLWRVHRAVPAKGEIGIFNRSQYEDVLAVRVHKLVPKEVWAARFEQINAFERLLVQNDITILKFFLHISKDEQKQRIKERIATPTKHWKLSPADLKERRYWDDYVEAYEDVLSRCSTKDAPWMVVPANHKWIRNLAVSSVIVETLEKMKLKFPKPAFDPNDMKLV